MIEKMYIYSNNEEIKKILERFKTEEKKLYYKIINTIELIGNFPIRNIIEIYETKDTKKEQYIKLYCTDLKDNIFIFCPISISKTDKTKIEKITDTDTITYDVSLSKKFEVTKENIDLLKANKIFNFKFGRLATDEKTYYNIFLGDNVCYKIQIDTTETINANEVLSELNKLEKAPSLKEYTDIFSKIIFEKNIEYIKIELGAYKNFESAGTFTIEGPKYLSK